MKIEANRIAEGVPVRFEMPDSFGTDFGEFGGEARKEADSVKGDAFKSTGPFNLPSTDVLDDMLDDLL
jgi:hypothetical protein